MKLPLTIEGQLEAYAAAKEGTARHEILWTTWKQNKRWITQLLEGNLGLFPSFSRHDASHALTVLRNIEMILGESRIALLSASDCFMILHTVYIHDVGMIITDAQKKEIVTNEKFIEMIDELSSAGDESSKKAAEILKRSEYFYKAEEEIENKKKLYEDKLEIYNAMIYLLAMYQRREHGEETKNQLYQWTKSPEKLGTGFSMSGIPQRIFLTIAECARMHTETGIEPIMSLPFEDNGYVFDYIHPRFVSVLLQIGDLLDMDNDRFHPLTITNMSDSPILSQMHFKKHLSIRKLHIRPDIIEIAADCDNQEALRLIRHEGDMLLNIMKQAGYIWSSICPPGFPGALPSVSVFDLRLNHKKIPTDLVSTKFEISQGRAFEILEGINIYTSKFVFLREFLQNALDATKLQYWKECQGTSGFYERGGLDSVKSPYDLEKYVTTAVYPIKIEMTLCKQNKKMKITPITKEDIVRLGEEQYEAQYQYGVKVRIKDFGIGIDQETLTRISNVGVSTNKKRKMIREMPGWLRPTAEFGVGLQSAFILVDSFKCYTHTRSEERYEITFGSGASLNFGGYINVKPEGEGELEDDTYGTCFEVFIPENKKMNNEECPESWSGEDFFDEEYEKRRPLRHSAELMSQMTLYLDSLIGETLFPIYLTLNGPSDIEIPVNQNSRNSVHTIRVQINKY